MEGEGNTRLLRSAVLRTATLPPPLPWYGHLTGNCCKWKNFPAERQQIAAKIAELVHTRIT